MASAYVPLAERRASYRIVVFRRPRAPWRSSKEAALVDAIRLGLASWDESKREHFLAVPTDLEMSYEPQEVVEGEKAKARDLAPRRQSQRARRQKTVRQFRIVAFGKPTPWRYDRELALDEARELGAASFCDRYRQWFFAAGCRMETREATCDAKGAARARTALTLDLRDGGG